jgi:hypothetical protein
VRRALLNKFRRSGWTQSHSCTLKTDAGLVPFGLIINEGIPSIYRN